MADTALTFTVSPGLKNALEALIVASATRHGLSAQQRWEVGRSSCLVILRLRGEPEAFVLLRADIERFMGALPIANESSPASRAMRAAISFAVGLAGVLGVALLARACT